MKHKYEVIFDCQLKSLPLIMHPAKFHVEGLNEWDAAVQAYINLVQEDKDNLNVTVVNVEQLEVSE